ncbi:MAG: hypothetical protein A3F72_16020 [Bacteroidetes bacterium RIFCSPLOWO2_12_FULL_35_15]|nr:MAG: hypothetical protein A3F72_16020 [Bacteroidetes bacterium RIFCSPLOWO2_12_FULL_35_15]
MGEVNNIIHWIAAGLLIPVIILLLFAFVKALILLGGFFGMYINRLKYSKEVNSAIKEVKNDKTNLVAKINAIKGDRSFTAHLKDLVAHTNDSLYSEKVLSDFEMAVEKDLSTSKSLARLGPMLGLMGTLIPMGGALVDMASGDMGSMAQNMQNCLSATVLGLFTGGIGFVTQLIKQRWYVEDLNNLEFLYNILKQNK